jgi:hydrogenase assembly chaperone HypC/HupF
MCVSSVVRVLDVDPATGTALVDDEGVRRRVSLAVLALEGPLPRTGDWLVVNTGLAVQQITADQAESIHAVRRALIDPDRGGQRP